MATVKMQKISIIGCDYQRDNIIDTLMEVSAVQINPQIQKLADEEYNGLLMADRNSKELSGIEQEISKVSAAMIFWTDMTKKEALFETECGD
jgi:vacuolar-type H+-ATPase subunit I/STV1